MLKWVVAVLCAGIVPAIAFYVFLTWHWDFRTEPGWAWVTISFMPAAILVPLFFAPTRQASLSRYSCAILLLHAALAGGLCEAGLWQQIAGMMLRLDLWLLVALLPSAIWRRPPGRLSRATILWTAALFGVGIPLSLANAIIVVWRAEASAGERPYCIQYASQTDAFAYEPVQTLFDLSALKMQVRLMSGGTDLFYFQNHAVLVIDGPPHLIFNWSYRSEAFLDEAVDRPEVFCHPATHYALHLPLWRPKAADVELSLAGWHFVIPEAFRPRAAIALKTAGRSRRDALVINAAPPDFAPYDLSNKHQTHFFPQAESDVTVTRAEQVDLSALIPSFTSGREARPVEPEFGLSKTEIHSAEAARYQNTTLVGRLYTAFDDAGRATGLIHCSAEKLVYGFPPSILPACRFWFVADGLTFELGIDDPAQWQAVENVLRARFRSFETDRANQQPQP